MNTLVRNFPATQELSQKAIRGPNFHRLLTNDPQVNSRFLLIPFSREGSRAALGVRGAICITIFGANKLEMDEMRSARPISRHIRRGHLKTLLTFIICLSILFAGANKNCWLVFNRMSTGRSETGFQGFILDLLVATLL